YNHISDSLHVYERHWQDLAKFEISSIEVPTNSAHLNMLSYDEWEKLWTELVDSAIRLTRHQKADDLLEVFSKLTHVPSAYVEWFALLTAEALRRRGYPTEAEK